MAGGMARDWLADLLAEALDHGESVQADTHTTSRQAAHGHQGWQEGDPQQAER